MFIFWWNTWIYQNANNGITFSVSLSVLKFEFSCAQYRYQQRMSSLWEKGLQGELGDLRQGKPAQDESKIVGFAHKIFKDCCVKRGRVISDRRNSLISVTANTITKAIVALRNPWVPTRKYFLNCNHLSLFSGAVTAFSLLMIRMQLNTSIWRPPLTSDTSPAPSPAHLTA